MSKRQLIDEIRQFNPTAQPKFLAQFDEGSLQEYLDNLQSAARKRRQVASWINQPSSLKMVS